MTREQQITQFLNGTDWSRAKRTPLTQDASFRRYWRLESEGGAAMLMDAPPPEKPVALFADIAQFLSQQGLCAPEIYALDNDAGLMLLQDFGDLTFTRLLSSDPESETRLYELAIDALIQLHQIQEDVLPPLPAYDPATLLNEAQLLIEWFYPAVTGTEITTNQAQQFNAAWQQSFDQLPPHQPALVLRDYHVDNLMRPQGAADTQCGLLDFQDALIGSPAYDLVSLLEDARRDICSDLQAHCLTRYFNTMRENQPEFPDQHSLTPWLNVLGAQRHAKVLGIFVRLCKRDQKPHYLGHLPRVLRLYQAAIEREPLLAPVAQWMQENLPFEEISLENIISSSQCN